MKSCADCGEKFEGAPGEELCSECIANISDGDDEINVRLKQLEFENSVLSKACEDQIKRIDLLEYRIETAGFKAKVLASHFGYCLGSHTTIQPSNAFEKSQEIFEILCPEWRESEESRITQELIDGKHHLIYGSNGEGEK